MKADGIADPRKIAIIGHSLGALFISAHLGSPADPATDAGRRDAYRRVVEDINRRGGEAEVIVLENEQHVPTNLDNVRNYAERAIQWLDARLSKRRPLGKST